MGPAILHLGRFSISSYAALISAGILLGLLVTYLEGRWRSQDVVSTMDAALWSLVAGIIGGRAAYVAVYWPYFSAHPREILSLSQGGLAFQGAFLAGVLALLAYALWNRRSFWELADTVAPGLALGQAVGWIGCLTRGCGFGLVASGSLAYDLRDIYGIMAFRYPTQAMIGVLNMGIFVLILILGRTKMSSRLPSGTLAALYLALNSAGLFLLEFFRADETLYFGTLRWSQIVEVAEFAAALLAVTLLVWTRRKRAVATEYSSASS
ncbi:MAG TPA: prolipoprotein diacylglyceryl transferase [Anaerolineae bacterium]|nr:prolipoprotein diacylglyceryl transferase [Anaerolineae bacterium]